MSLGKVWRPLRSMYSHRLAVLKKLHTVQNARLGALMVIRSSDNAPGGPQGGGVGPHCSCLLYQYRHRCHLLWGRWGHVEPAGTGRGS